MVKYWIILKIINFSSDVIMEWWLHYIKKKDCYLLSELYSKIVKMDLLPSNTGWEQWESIKETRLTMSPSSMTPDD
jgi:hypothetical protein